MSRDELTNCIIYQVSALKGFLEAEAWCSTNLHSR